MSKVDWSLAPEDATHFGKGEDCGYWVKLDGAKQYFINISSWDNGKWKESPEPDDVSLLIERPRKQWSGPEDGLPPVGIACERRFPSVTASSWQGGIILAHGSKKIFFRDNCGDEWAHSFDDVEFRALRTTAQIAAEKRETAIREIMDVADVDCRVTAARLVDAGFKLPSKSESRDNAVDAMELIVPHIGSVAAGKLYDAGFKREVK